MSVGLTIKDFNNLVEHTQNQFDKIGHDIQETLELLRPYNEWLDTNGDGNWEAQLTTYLAKLPLRSARNIVQSLYSTLSLIAYTLVHPIDGTYEIVESLVNLIKALAEPANWTQIGGGIVGSNLGVCLILGTPVSAIGFGVGMSLTCAGLIFGGGRAKQLKKLPESFLTGFFVGIVSAKVSQVFARKNEADCGRPFDPDMDNDFFDKHGSFSRKMDKLYFPISTKV